MKKTIALALLLAAPAAFAQEAQECRVLVAKDWIAMGTTTLSGCLKFADEAATPGERQFAKLGETFLKVQGVDHFQSSDGGNTWAAISAAPPAGGFDSLNVLEPPQGEAAQLASPEPARPATVVKKKKRRHRY